MKTEEAKENKETKEKKSGSPAGIIIGVIIFALLLTADLVTKFLAVKYLTLGESIRVIPKVLSWTLTYNSGMAFGFLSGTTVGMVIITAFTVIIMAGIAVAFVKTGLSRPGLKIILAIVEAGAVGNLVDRIMMFTGQISGVRDFIDISSVNFFSFINGGFNFGICNVADFAVTLGGAALVIYMIFFFATDGGKEEEESSPLTDRENIFLGEYSEKDVSSLEEVSLKDEDSSLNKDGDEK